jgi:hypothetical protein
MELTKQTPKATGLINWWRLLISVPACVALLVMTSRLQAKLVSVTKDHVTTLFWVAHKYPTVAPSAYDPSIYLHE